MHAMDNTKIIETVERQAAMNYFEKLSGAKMQKLVLFSVFPYTAAANMSDPHYLVLIEDIAHLAGLNSGSFNN